MAVHFFKVKTHGRYRALIVSLLSFVVIVGGVLALINQTQSRGGSEQLTILKDALHRAAASCYAVEGRYPPTLQYLVDNYGVVINQDKYIVRYDAFAENIMPDIMVLEVGKERADDADDEG